MNDTSPPCPALQGTRILSLAPNLPGPMALLRCQRMGATCTKIEPPAPPGAAQETPGDPLGQYSHKAYAALHQDIAVLRADLKTEAGQAALHAELARSDVLLTSSRPRALARLGLDWESLQRKYPWLSLVSIVAAPGARADEPGHDLTFVAQHDLIDGLQMPATLLADMCGALMASEAVLRASLHQWRTGQGTRHEVALSDAAAFLALPRQWGLMGPESILGGAHAGYRVYPCKDGRVALAALEPHFAAPLRALVGLEPGAPEAMLAPQTHAAVAAFVLTQTREQLENLAQQHDIPLQTMR